MKKELDKVEALARGSKIKRLLYDPWKYFYALFIVKMLHRKNGIIEKATTFFGAPMSLLLPASTDIYLTGGKTHDSEIRLAKYFIAHVQATHQAIDIGAHFGYFTLLFSALAREGHVYSFEPSNNNYALLEANTRKKNITIDHRAVSRQNGSISFFEFPVLFSESNSIYADQYQNEQWFKDSGFKEITVECITLDSYCKTHSIMPDFIKIDVEGAEHDVISGAQNILRQSNPVIAMEFVCPERGNKNHHTAQDLLHQMGYTSYVIRDDGSLREIKDINKYLDDKKLESDNIIFKTGR